MPVLHRELSMRDWDALDVGLCLIFEDIVCCIGVDVFKSLCMGHEIGIIAETELWIFTFEFKCFFCAYAMGNTEQMSVLDLEIR